MAHMVSIYFAELEYLVWDVLGRHKDWNPLHCHPYELVGNQMATTEIKVLYGHKKTCFQVYVRDAL